MCTYTAYQLILDSLVVEFCALPRSISHNFNVGAKRCTQSTSLFTRASFHREFGFFLKQNAQSITFIPQQHRNYTISAIVMIIVITFHCTEDSHSEKRVLFFETRNSAFVGGNRMHFWHRESDAIEVCSVFSAFDCSNLRSLWGLVQKLWEFKFKVKKTRSNCWSSATKWTKSIDCPIAFWMVSLNIETITVQFWTLFFGKIMSIAVNLTNVTECDWMDSMSSMW